MTNHETFQAWWTANWHKFAADESAKQLAANVWNAATKIEREACAKVCVAMRDTNEENPEYGSWGEHDDCADAIRAR